MAAFALLPGLTHQQTNKQTNKNKYSTEMYKYKINLYAYIGISLATFALLFDPTHPLINKLSKYFLLFIYFFVQRNSVETCLYLQSYIQPRGL